VFEMTSRGLAEVTNPSALFLSDRDKPASGSIVFSGIEGSRPVLTEIQALVAPSPNPQARRTVVGLDSQRLATILAVLESRCGVPFAGLDVYLNVAGGMRVSEPAADLAVAAALLSAREDKPLPPECVVFGEISLSGALRPVTQAENRLKEASKLGFTSAIGPVQKKLPQVPGMSLNSLPDLVGFVAEYFNDEAK
jgi:DNA repair protein RadA/Sms